MPHFAIRGRAGAPNLVGGLLLHLVLAAAPASAQTGQVTGTVTHADTSSPLPSITVLLYSGNGALTSLDATLPPGAYDLVVYPHSAVTGDFHGAVVSRVVIRD